MHYKSILPLNFVFDSTSVIHINKIRTIILNFIKILFKEEIQLIYPSKFNSEKPTGKYIYFQMYKDIDYTIGYNLYQACKLMLTNDNLITDYKFNKELLHWLDDNRLHGRVELHQQLNLLIYYKEHQRIIRFLEENAPGYLKYIDVLKRKLFNTDYSSLYTVNNYQTFEYNLLNGINNTFEINSFLNKETNSTEESLTESLIYFEKLHKDLTDDFYLKNKLYESSVDKQKLIKLKEKQIEYFTGKTKVVLLLKSKFNYLNTLKNTNIKISESTEVNGNQINVIRINDFNMNLINNNLFDLFKINKHIIELNKNSIIEGVKLGKNILDKLKYRTVENETKNSRLEYGKIDKKLLPELIWGNTKINYTSDIKKALPYNVILSVDYSKSMATKHNSMLTLLSGLIYAINQIPNLTLKVYLRYTINDGEDIKPTLLKIFEKSKNTFNDVLTLFPYLQCKGGSPEGILHNELLKEIKTTNNVYFINISDGKPEFLSTKLKYVNDLGINHTKQTVLLLKKYTNNILSFFIGDEHDTPTFKSIYGKNSVVITDNNLYSIGNIINNFLI